jgi:peptidoglycan/LPS O-acetylase OafA/YrhL
MRSGRIPALDGLRAIAFLLVFCSHAVSDRIFPGGLGVTLFFFLSGYLITTLLRAEMLQTRTVSLRQFYLRRARRILAPMYITIALGYAVSYAGIVSASSSVRAGLSATLFVYNYYSIWTGQNLPAGMNVVWSLMIEEHFYAIFPIVFRIFQERRWSARCQTLALVSACLFALAWRCFLVEVAHSSLEPARSWTYRATDTRFDSILWGCVLAIACNPFPEGGNSPAMSRRGGQAALLGLGVILATLCYRNGIFRETLRYTLQSLALLPIFHYCISHPFGRVTRCLDCFVFKWIGQLSYAMYLVHALVLTVLAHYIGKDRLALACAGLFLTLGFALAMRRFVEEPLRRAFPRRASLACK